MNNYTKIIGICALSATASSAFAGIIVGGDFNSPAYRTGGGLVHVESSDLNGGWIGSDNPNRIFNGLSNTTVPSQYGSYLTDSTSGNGGGGFFLATNGTASAAGRTTAWNLFSMDAIGESGFVTDISFDAAVFSDYNTADAGVVTTTGANINNTANVQFALYGFTGDATALATALSSNSILGQGYHINDPAGFGFTSIINTNLSAVSSLSTDAAPAWETQNFSIAGATTYDYYLLGVVSTGNAVQGVGLDNISIAAVPEPSTYIAGLGFVALGYFIYRRRAKKAIATTEEVAS
ncbi:PEP-CTERM sorting domain-containing protein [Cerasicoccus arenae]|uniref:Ice-binding protein C-terminal domain-containing protein n=1 Tax=Cerasicoccus arenae TaxID=424488 RepID=A0A8J3DEV3_9BACT|nr:PEP-CTERM sorting domain-containing protein [Cerasicoccus arenae]MBK1857023.1 PEP-CTERM sorting domain-containing protein [Cerasicoccus arenae]GHB91918.1 hypothetical protein GCM10007047_03550 [Cerasicoccus arenae]